jgi:chromosome segregation ATPase
MRVIYKKKEERISIITKENSQLKHKLTKVEKKLQDSISKVANLKQQVSNDKQYICDLNQQLAYEQKYIQKQTSELDKLKSQYIDIKTTSSQNEVNLCIKTKDISALNSKVIQLKADVATKVKEIQTLKSELSSKTMELREKEADLSSKTFEIQAIETECKVYKQRLNDMALSKIQEKHQVSRPDSTISTNTSNISSDETKLGGFNTQPMIPVTKSTSIGLLILLILIMLIIIFFTYKHKFISIDHKFERSISPRPSKMNSLIKKNIKQKNDSNSYPRSTREYSYLPRRW